MPGFRVQWLLLVVLSGILAFKPTVSRAADDRIEGLGDGQQTVTQANEDYDELVHEAGELMMIVDWPAAFRTLNRAIELYPDRPEAYYTYGRGHVLRSEYKSAERAFLKAREVDPSIAAVWYELAKLSSVKGELNEALDCAREAILLSEGEDWTYLVLLGEIFAEMELKNSAEDAFDQAIAVLKKRIRFVDDAISKFNNTDEVTDIIEGVDYVVDPQSKEIVEVPTIRYETRVRVAPDEWNDDSLRLKKDLATVEARKAAVMEWIDSI